MPTQATFLAAASALDEVADDAEQLIPPVQRALTPDVLRGGLFTDEVHRAVDDADLTARVVAGNCRNAADECRVRAHACELYWQEVAQWEAATDRYVRQLRAWQNRRLAQLNDPTLPDPGPHPRSPGPQPAKLYDWID